MLLLNVVERLQCFLTTDVLGRPGEDPTLNAAYAAEFPAGMQGPDPNRLKASACLKHYVACASAGQLY